MQSDLWDLFSTLPAHELSAEESAIWLLGMFIGISLVMIIHALMLRRREFRKIRTQKKMKRVMDNEMRWHYAGEEDDHPW